MSPESPSSANFFEDKYTRQPDPWHFASNPYELSRYHAIIDSLAIRRYKKAFEPGCSVGVLTAQLATICDTVEAIDFSPTAVNRAREQCAGLSNVKIECKSLPECMPICGFDLIVLSEIGYYFSAAEWSEISTNLIASMLPGSTLLAAHWLGTSPDHCTSGDQVHATLHASSDLDLEHAEHRQGFRIDRWIRV